MERYQNRAIIRDLQKKYKYKAYQIVKELKRERMEDGIEIIQAKDFLKSLDL